MNSYGKLVLALRRRSGMGLKDDELREFFDMLLTGLSGKEQKALITLFETANKVTHSSHAKMNKPNN